MWQQCERVRQIPPAQRLLTQREDIGAAAGCYPRYQGREVGDGGACGKVPVPQRHVESGVLATHETSGANAVPVSQRERQQQHRPVFSVIGNNDEWLKLLALSGLTLPGRQEIEPLKGRGKVLLVLKAAPHG